jgi:hypothetical protein
MYDVNVFLENRREIVCAIDKLSFNFDGVGDYDIDSFEVELTRGNMQLVINASIRKTLTASVDDTYDVQGYDEYETDLEDINEAFYYTSEGDEIPCTDNEIEIIKNVIKSLL